MRDLNLPDGFQAHWEGGTLRVVLPEMAETTSHRYEPVLSKADAKRLAAAIGEHEKARQADPGPAPGFAPLTRIVLQREPDFALESAAKFRERVVLALYDLGLHPKLELAVAPRAQEAPRVLPEPVLPEPRIPRVGMTTPVPALTLEATAPAAVSDAARRAIDPLAETDHEIELDIEVLTAMSTPPPPAPAAPPPVTPPPAAPPPPPPAPPTATADGATAPTTPSPAPTPARKKSEAPIPSRKRFERHTTPK